VIKNLYQKMRFWNRRRRYRIKDKLEIETIRRYLNEGQVVLDIGAHKGVYTSFFRDEVGDDGIIVCFEPQQVLGDYLSKTISLFKWRNVHLERLALSEKNGEASFFVPGHEGETSPSASLEGSSEGVQGHSQVVQTVTLDDYCSKKGLYPNFIKCDVEGHEYSVLKGGVITLGKYHPAVMLECEQRHLRQASVFDVFNFMQGLGYRGYFFGTNDLIPIEDFELTVHQNQSSARFWEAEDYVNNFLFVAH